MVLMTHGMTFHSGYYGTFAGRLVAEGVAVVAADLQGHGLSDGYDGMRGGAPWLPAVVRQHAYIA